MDSVRKQAAAARARPNSSAGETALEGSATLRPGVVYVLEADAGGGAGGAGDLEARAWAVLPDDERTRAERMTDPGARRRFVTGRACLRSVLARLAQVAARDLRFGYGARGKPFLPGGPSFSLSHSGERVLIAVTARGRVGADVERIRPVRRLESVAARWFAPGERAWLSAAPESEREAAFFAVWARKEAFAKALGHGLATPFRAFSVDMGADRSGSGPRGGLATSAVVGERAGAWTVTGLATEPGMVAAVAADWRDATVDRLPPDGWSACLRATAKTGAERP